MTVAAELLTERIRQAGARRVAFVGLSKNAGKTTALTAVLEELHRRGIAAGTTSAGLDGEPWDLLTGQAKPRFRLFPGQLVASADSTFLSASFPSELVERLGFRTRFGPIVIRRAKSSGEVEMIGPSTAAQIAETCAALETAGAELVLLDGAFGRRAFASARVADAVVLSVGMAAGRTLPAVLERARFAVELLDLPAAPAGRSIRPLEGALTDTHLLENPPGRGEVLLVDDFASIFLSREGMRRLREKDVTLAVRRPARLLAVTSNPTAPGSSPMPPATFFQALSQAVPGVAVLDLESNLAKV